MRKKIILCGYHWTGCKALELAGQGYKGEEQSRMCSQYKRGCSMNGRIGDTTDDGGNVIVYGCGGHARSIINTIQELCDRMRIILVDSNAQPDEIIMGCKTEREHKLRKTDGYIIAIGDNKARSELYRKLDNLKTGNAVSVVSKYASVGMEAVIGRGVFVAANAYIGPQAEIGDNVIINTGSVVEHETKIGNNVHVAPHATICGRAKIGNSVLCGAGSVVIDNISICDNAIIGAGAVVKENITDAGLYVGVPARLVRKMKRWENEERGDCGAE